MAFLPFKRQFFCFQAIREEDEKRTVQRPFLITSIDSTCSVINIRFSPRRSRSTIIYILASIVRESLSDQIKYFI